MSLKFIPTKGMPATDNFAKRMFQDITEIDGSSVAQSSRYQGNEGTVSKSFYAALTTHTIKRKSKTNHTDEHGCKKFKQNISKMNPAIYKGDICNNQFEFISCT